MRPNEALVPKNVSVGALFAFSNHSNYGQGSAMKMGILFVFGLLSFQINAEIPQLDPLALNLAASLNQGNVSCFFHKYGGCQIDVYVRTANAEGMVARVQELWANAVTRDPRLQTCEFEVPTAKQRVFDSTDYGLHYKLSGQYPLTEADARSGLRCKRAFLRVLATYQHETGDGQRMDFEKARFETWRDLPNHSWYTSATEVDYLLAPSPGSG